MKTLLIFICLSTVCFLQSEANKPLICQWQWTLNSENISLPTHLCTHVMYNFIYANQASGTLSPGPSGGTEKTLSEIVALKTENPSLKISLAVEWYFNAEEEISKLEAYPRRTEALVVPIMDWVDKYHLDGIDLSWHPIEYLESHNFKTADAIKELRMLVHALRAALGEAKLLTMSYQQYENQTDVPSYIRALEPYVDFFLVGSTDLRAAYVDEVIGNPGTLYSSSGDEGVLKQLTVANLMKIWADRGVPRNKLLLGLSFRGADFKLRDPNHHSQGDRAQRRADSIKGIMASYKKYKDICETLLDSRKGIVGFQNWTRVFDNETKTPYALNGDSWIGYEDSESIMHKTDFINLEGFGGAWIRDFSADDTENRCGDGTYPLTTAAARGLAG